MSDRVHGRGWTPLMYAASAGDLAVVRLLIERGADVDARDSQTAATPLMLAASAGHAQVVITLLDDGHAELRAVDVHERDAQEHAARGGHDDVSRMLGLRAVPFRGTLKFVRPDGSSAEPRHDGQAP